MVAPYHHQNLIIGHWKPIFEGAIQMCSSTTPSPSIEPTQDHDRRGREGTRKFQVGPVLCQQAGPVFDGGQGRQREVTCLRLIGSTRDECDSCLIVKHKHFCDQTSIILTWVLV